MFSGLCPPGKRPPCSAQESDIACKPARASTGIELNSDGGVERWTKCGAGVPPPEAEGLAGRDARSIRRRGRRRNVVNGPGWRGGRQISQPAAAGTDRGADFPPSVALRRTGSPLHASNAQMNGQGETKPQTPEKFQITSCKAAKSRVELGFGAWEFSGVWCFHPGRTLESVRYVAQPFQAQDS